MISMSAVQSASGAAGYFAQDNYYTAHESADSSNWAGAGSAKLGLSGKIEEKQFADILNGSLPDGTQLGSGDWRHGSDFTFSMPKSASLLAYVSGDKRLLTEHMNAVKDTMAWAEKNLAETRMRDGSERFGVKTGNLVYALFEHDTSREQDPQGHIHAVIANMTQLPEHLRKEDTIGKDGDVIKDHGWRSWHNDKMFKSNATLGSIYHANFKDRVQNLGYETEELGKHGSFEIKGVDQKSIEGFSKRRSAIVEKAEELGITTSSGMEKVTLGTRDNKKDAGDRDELDKAWKEEAKSFGYVGDKVFSESLERVEKGNVFGNVKNALSDVRSRVGNWLDTPNDPLVDNGIHKLTNSPEAVRTQYAVASAIRMMSEREAAFPVDKLSKKALDLGFAGVTQSRIETRLSELFKKGEIIPEKANDRDGHFSMITTKEALALEESIVAQTLLGEGKGNPLVTEKEAEKAISNLSEYDLNKGQMAAAKQIVSSKDRVVIVQGVAGAGKSTMLAPVAKLMEQKSVKGRGLAFQNKMVVDLKDGTGMDAQTVHSFIGKFDRAMKSDGNNRHDNALAELKGSYLVLDEAGVISNKQMASLTKIANHFEVGKLAIIGDRQQLSSIDAGKAFSVQQSIKEPTLMNENLRQKTPLLKTVAALADKGKSAKAIQLLGDNVVEGPDHVTRAADTWLSLSPEERDRTSLYSSGRAVRATLNTLVQDGLKSDGILVGPGKLITVRENVNMTKEDFRYSESYKSGDILEVAKRQNDLGIGRGDYKILNNNIKGGVDVLDKNGKVLSFNPQKMDPKKLDNLKIAREKNIRLFEGDKTRWTANDKKRDLFNSSLAKVTKIDGDSITFKLANGKEETFKDSDPMLQRTDLAYSLNMHMAQGETADRGIGVMGSNETNLSNQRLFNVLVSRVRESLTIITDDKMKLMKQIQGNEGDKTSSLETLDKLPVVNDNKFLAIDKVDGNLSNEPTKTGKSFALILQRFGFLTGPGEDTAKNDQNIKLPDSQKDLSKSHEL